MQLAHRGLWDLEEAQEYAHLVAMQAEKHGHEDTEVDADCDTAGIKQLRRIAVLGVCNTTHPETMPN